MRRPSRDTALAWLYVSLLSLGLGAGLLTAVPSPQDDQAYYQQFTEALAQGRLDLSIPGFHGSDFLAVPWYLLTGSSIAQIYSLIFLCLLLPPAGFLAGKALYGSDWHGVMLASIVALMPFISFVCLRGWTGPGYWFLMLMTVYAAAKQSRWTGPLWGLSILTKPFAVALLPLLVYLAPKGKPAQRYAAIGFGLAIVAGYLLIQIAQTGHILVGAHTEVTQTSVWQGPARILLNLAHSLQILFSVHNYYFPDPALTGPGNMLHTTPLLIFLGLFGLLAPNRYFTNKQLPRALLLGALIGLGMNALLDHMDHFYMEAAVLIFILASLPILRAHRLWIPLVLATLHFQWFYFYLQYRPGFQLTSYFFLTPLIIDACFLVWCVGNRRDVWNLLKFSDE